MDDAAFRDAVLGALQRIEQSLDYIQASVSDVSEIRASLDSVEIEVRELHDNLLYDEEGDAG